MDGKGDHGKPRAMFDVISGKKGIKAHSSCRIATEIISFSTDYRFCVGAGMMMRFKISWMPCMPNGTSTKYEDHVEAICVSMIPIPPEKRDLQHRLRVPTSIHQCSACMLEYAQQIVVI
jgi:hypothetical protein